jgi:hypothetical protein
MSRIKKIFVLLCVVIVGVLIVVFVFTPVGKIVSTNNQGIYGKHIGNIVIASPNGVDSNKHNNWQFANKYPFGFYYIDLSAGEYAIFAASEIRSGATMILPCPNTKFTVNVSKGEYKRYDFQTSPDECKPFGAIPM